MAHNKLYRNFIILQEDEKSHSKSADKPLSGYAKIEAKGDKCKISFYAQNLKKDEKYTILLICYKKDMKQIVDLGELQVSEVGKGEAIKEYYINDIAGLNFSYEKISGAAICKHKNEQLLFLMYGFMNNENIKEDWKKAKVVKGYDKNSSVPQYKKAEKDNSKIKDDIKKESKDDHKHNDKNKEKYHKNNDGCGCEQCPRVDDEKNADSITQKDFDEYEENINRSKQNQEVDPYDFELRGAMGDFFNNIVKGFEEVKGKFKDIKYCKWYKIKIGSIDDMCNTSDYNKYTVAYYPMLNYYPYIKKYGYFFIGYKCDSKGNLKYIVYGIPGNKDKDEQPYVGKTGFVTWIDSDDGKVGCWLMFYDYKNSNIVVPMK